MIANIITISRIPMSLSLLFISPGSIPFSILYLLCGISDMTDGYIARRLHTAGKSGEMLDTAADLVFAVVYAVRIIPYLHIPIPILIWASLVAVIKATAIVLRKMRIEHSAENRLTGLLLFIMPLTALFADVAYCAMLVCASATYSAVKELISSLKH